MTFSEKGTCLGIYCPPHCKYIILSSSLIFYSIQYFNPHGFIYSIPFILDIRYMNHISSPHLVSELRFLVLAFGHTSFIVSPLNHGLLPPLAFGYLLLKRKRKKSYANNFQPGGPKYLIL